MDWPISETKVLPPQVHPTTISRLRLHTLLDQSLSCRLFLVIAPAGYGKTTMLTDWTRSLAVPVGWYSLSDMDLNSHRFYAHFVAALRALFPDFGTESMAMLGALTRAQASVEQLAATVVHELADHIEQDFVLVLDDYHLVDQEEEINSFVSFFAQTISSACHIILSSRTLLGLPDLDLMVARGQVSGLDYEELAFRPEEVQQLAQRQYKRKLTLEQATQLTNLSEGWITGLLLSADLRQWLVGDQLRVLRATGIDLYTYFAQQVLDKQAPSIRQFLLRTSMFEEFDTAFCTSVLGHDLAPAGADLGKAFDYVRRHNLFVTAVGHRGEQVRYHALFQDFAREQFIRESPQEVMALSHRLAARYAADQKWEQVHQLYSRLGDVPAQTAFLLQHGQSMLRAGQMQLLVRWIDEIPQMVRLDHPILKALHGAALVSTGATDFGVALLSEVETMLTTDNDALVRARVLVYRSAGYRMLGMYGEAFGDAELALELAGRPHAEANATEVAECMALASRLKGLALYMMGSTDHLTWLFTALRAYQELRAPQDSAIVSMEIGLAYLSQADFRQAVPWLESAASAWRDLRNVAGQANVLNNLGYLHLLRGDFEASAAALLEALHAARRSGYRRMEAYILSGIADLMASIGFTQGALRIYAQAKTLTKRVNERFLALYIELAEARLDWLARDFGNAYQTLNNAGRLVLNRDSDYEWSLYRLTIGRFYLAMEKPVDALEPLKDALEHFENGRRTVDVAIARMYLAVALAPTELIEAKGCIEQAISGARENEFYGHLVAICAAEGGLCDPLLDHDSAGSVIRDFARDCREFHRKSMALRQTLGEKLFAPFGFTAAEHIPELTIRGFGRPEVFVVGDRVTTSQWTVTAARDMFFCLLAHPEGLTKEQIGLLFWPDCTTKQLKTRFKNTLYRLRNAVARDDVIIYADEVYRFNRELDFAYDVEQFAELAAIAQSEQDAMTKLATMRSALDLYQGPFLDTVDAHWVLAERVRYQEMFINLGLQLAGWYLELDQASDALVVCRRILGDDPTLEEAHRLAMRVHAAMGNRAEIANQYEQCVAVLRDEIGVDPSDQTIDLYLRLIE